MRSAPTGRGFVLGTDWGCAPTMREGAERWKQAVPGIPWGVNLSADGRIVVAAYGDGTVRWHRWSDGQELLALFVNKDTKAWVAWTPSGYYMASPGGEDLIGWHINRGWDQAADFFPASRFRDKYSRPDIVKLVLDTLDEREAIKQANAPAHKSEEAKPVIERLPPVLTMLSPADGTVVSSGPLAVAYSVRSPSGGPSTESRPSGWRQGRSAGLARPDGQTGTLILPMPAHDATVSLVRLRGCSRGRRRAGSLEGSWRTVALADPDALKPTLYALLVGVSHYENGKLDLGYPAKDAIELAAALQAQKGRLYRDVQVKVLTDKEATARGR